MRVLLAFVFLAIILRVPSLFEPYWYGDEAIYLTLGEGIRQNLVFYKDIFDHKPPAIYFLAAVAGSVFWFRLILLFWHAATIVLFWELCEYLFSKKPKMVILATGLFTLLTTIPLLEGNIANSEIFMIGPTIAGFLLVFTGKKSSFLKLFLAGILFSLATLFKVPAFFDFLALIVFWLFSVKLSIKALKETIKKMVVVGLGLLPPILASIIYFWSQDALPQFIYSSWSQNFTYLSRWQAPALSVFETIAQAGLVARAAVLGGIILTLFVFRKRFDTPTLFASIWFSFALFAALIPGRPYPHYIIQVIPPLSILVAILALGKERYRFLSIPFLGVLLLSLVFYKFYYYPSFPYYKNFIEFAVGQKSQMQYFEHFDRRMPTLYTLNAFLSQRTTRDDKIFIWGTMPELYALSGRLPPGRYITSFHITDFQGEEETLKSLENNKPAYIFTLREEQRSFPGFSSFLQSNYIYLQNIDTVDVWKLFDPKLMKI